MYYYSMSNIKSSCSRFNNLVDYYINLYSAVYLMYNLIIILHHEALPSLYLIYIYITFVSDGRNIQIPLQ